MGKEAATFFFGANLASADPQTKSIERICIDFFPVQQTDGLADKTGKLTLGFALSSFRNHRLEADPQIKINIFFVAALITAV